MTLWLKSELWTKLTKMKNDAIEKASQIDHTSPFLVCIHSTDDDYHYLYVTVRSDDRNRLILCGCSKKLNSDQMK